MRFAAFSVSLAIGLTCLVGAQQPPVKTTTTGVVIDVSVVDGKASAVLARRAALAYVSTLTPPHDYAGSRSGRHTTCSRISRRTPSSMERSAKSA